MAFVVRKGKWFPLYTPTTDERVGDQAFCPICGEQNVIATVALLKDKKCKHLVWNAAEGYAFAEKWPPESKKSPEMEKILNKMTEQCLGKSRNGKQCVTCGSTAVKAEDFRDDISRKEFGISFTCQACIDSMS